MLLINNNRSKAYLQSLVLNGFIPERIVVLDNKNIVLPEHTENDKFITQNTKQIQIRKVGKLKLEFDEKEHITTTITKNKIKHTIIDCIDVNSNIVLSEIKKIKEDYIIYSGPGGTILSKKILNQNKKFIHVHPGLLPKHRGSTTFYYSYLIDYNVGASVIIMNEKIDQGPIIYSESFLIDERDVDFDHELDPILRARVLINCFKKNKFSAIKQNNKESYTFYIIHPLLKHIAILLKK